MVEAEAVIPILIVTRAWSDSVPFSPADIAFVFDLDVKGAMPALDGQHCPQCGRNPVESAIRLFAPDPKTATAERVEGRETVQCVCRTTYHYPAVHELNVNDPTGAAVVRAASVRLRPHTGALTAGGQEPVLKVEPLTIHVHDDVTVNTVTAASARAGTCGPTVIIETKSTTPISYRGWTIRPQSRRDPDTNHWRPRAEVSTVRGGSLHTDHVEAPLSVLKETEDEANADAVTLAKRRIEREERQ